MFRMCTLMHTTNYGSIGVMSKNSQEVFEQLRNSSACERSSAWRSSEEMHAFAATMYIKRCGRQLLESHTAFKVYMLWL